MPGTSARGNPSGIRSGSLVSYCGQACTVGARLEDPNVGYEIVGLTLRVQNGLQTVILQNKLEAFKVRPELAFLTAPALAVVKRAAREDAAALSGGSQLPELSASQRAQAAKDLMQLAALAEKAEARATGRRRTRWRAVSLLVVFAAFLSRLVLSQPGAHVTHAGGTVPASGWPSKS